LNRKRIHTIAFFLCLILALGSLVACVQEEVQDPSSDENDEEQNSQDPGGEVPPNELPGEEDPDENESDPVVPDPPSPKPPKSDPPEEESGKTPPAAEGWIGDLTYSVVTGTDTDGRTMILNVDSILVLVNKNRNLPSSYSPKDLVKPNVRFSFSEDVPKRYLQANAARALERLFKAASDAGHRLYGVSGYRSYATQKSIFERNAAQKGEEVANRTSARPGQSEHQTGLAMDISSASVDYRLSTSFGDTAEGKWVRDNAYKYGFIIRYPKGTEGITGYSYEPWHIRYVGTTAADYIYRNNLTLEEYFQQRYSYP
jgi:zinc D-Ala-D-Ala carboxypeptidase